MKQLETSGTGGVPPSILRNAAGGNIRAEPPLDLAGVLSWTLSQFNDATRVIAVRSKVLSCVVLFAADDAAIPEGNTRTVYRVRELRELLKLNPTPEDLRRIHLAKTLFNGSIENDGDHRDPAGAGRKPDSRATGASAERGRAGDAPMPEGAPSFGTDAPEAWDWEWQHGPDIARSVELADARLERTQLCGSHREYRWEDHLLRMLGAVASAQTFEREGFAVDRAFEDPVRDGEPDLIVTGDALSMKIAVKTSSEETWGRLEGAILQYEYSKLEHVADAVLWCRVDKRRIWSREQALKAGFVTVMLGYWSEISDFEVRGFIQPDEGKLRDSSIRRMPWRKMREERELFARLRGVAI